MATVLKAIEPADTARIELDQWIAATQSKSLLRFITCGSVDDGKSTLIGRLLYDSKLLLEDQLATLAQDSSRTGRLDQELDFASLVDGLAAEREQGITIDVAYRFFTTDKRKFIVADTPGHEQYTRNMVTGASTADLAIILVDARKGLLTQTRRHSFLAYLLGIRNIVLAVNKMDLVGYDHAVFDEIVADYRAFADEAGISGFTAIPLSGRAGDNVTARSERMAWYSGPALLDHLETVPVSPRIVADQPFRMAVQWVNRPNQGFRGYAGRIASGKVTVGDEIVVLPGGRRSRIERIVTYDGDLAQAVEGQSVTLSLADDLDCSRGDLIASPQMDPSPVSRFAATLVWMSDQKLAPRRSYLLKIGTTTVPASVDVVKSVIDVNSLERRTGQALALNDIGEVVIDLDRAVPAIAYAESRKLGGFILIDRLTHATVAAGIVTGFPHAPVKSAAHKESIGSIHWVTGPRRHVRAAHAVDQMRARGLPAFCLDEAALRGFPSSDPVIAAREVARLMSAAGVEVFVAFDVPAGEAHPGHVLADDGQEERGDAWVI